MFFQGTLQEGIATAVQQSKSVVCFVTDGEAESQQWEDEFLTDSDVEQLLQTGAVSLRLAAGSQEEGHLTQFYPVPKKPTVVVIKNGELREYIAAGVSKDDFVRRIQAVLQPAPAPVPAATPLASQPQPSLGGPSTGSSSGQTTPPSSNESQIQSMLAERAARLEAQKKRDEEEAKRRRAKKAKAQADVGTANPASKGPQSKHADELKKRQKEAREERQRILKAIEDDKAARRARQAEAEAERRAAAAAAEKANGDATTPFAPASQLLPSTGRLHEGCAIQVRLFDGSTIRSRFSSVTDTIKEVRQWVDDTRHDGDTPYTFKILLTPLPSKAIDKTEEDQTLQSLGLAPSSTLILVPLVAGKKYYSPRVFSSAASSSSAARSGVEAGSNDEADDDAQGEGGNIFTRFIVYVLAIITGIFSVILSFFSTIFSVRGPPEPLAPSSRGEQVSSSSSSATATGRDRGAAANLIKGFSNRQEDEQQKQKNDDKQQFYNGNSTNFEPRRGDDE
ncbi:hypothetical protein B0H66DRAFT_81672 [Apodospora peruviana]|uniref:UBX domain-containing protein 2 n=1 Tax=Apodospora peruviana TaxID=516989 RepID=A0AAE0MFS1_9PEZI|nr:hypothetical protein B0H66DRAFT_81672 [Apodospora peruviana]